MFFIALFNIKLKEEESIMFRLLSYLAILVFSANVLGESSVSGTYALKWSKNAGCVIKAHQISKDKLQFE